MYFYDIDEKGLPADAEYYFNILVLCVAIAPSRFEMLGNIEDVWYLDRIAGGRPAAWHFYIDYDIDEDSQYIEVYRHMVLEVSPTLGVSFYDMLKQEDNEQNWELT